MNNTIEKLLVFIREFLLSLLNIFLDIPYLKYTHIFLQIKKLLSPQLKTTPGYIINENKNKKSLFIRDASNIHKIGLNKVAKQEESNLRMYHQPFTNIFHCRYKEVN